MQQLNLQLYARTAKTRFNEKLSVRRSVALTPDPVMIELEIEPPAGEKFIELRLDPDDKPSTFVLRSLAVRAADGAELYEWDGNPDSLTGLANLRASMTRSEVLLQSSSDDPFLLVPLTDAREGAVFLELMLAEPLLTEGEDQLGNMAEAVRGLQTSLRLAIDDLASEHEGLQETLILSLADARRESQAINERLSEAVTRAGSLDSRATDLETSLKESTRQIRNEILGEIRDDWRSVRQQISDVADAVARRGRESDAAITANVEAEFAKLVQVVNRFAASDDLLKQVRNELGVARDDEAIERLRKLKDEARNAREEVNALKASLSWRLTRPFRAFSKNGPD